MSKLIALVDINNAYASMERLFRPDLKGRPIVVLSSNDGNVVARSAEAKAMGIKMGVPYFQIRSMFEAQGGVSFSSNFALYGDMSARFMAVVGGMVSEYSPYSIDEVFCTLDPCLGDPTAYCRTIRARVEQWLGLTVGIGIGPTRTLSKLANYAAKRWQNQTGGVVDLSDPERRAKLMARTPVSEVWGVGRSLTAKLESQGIMTVADLVAVDPRALRKKHGVVLERIAMELRGIPCQDLQELVAAKKQIMVSRSFGHRITAIDDMRQAIAGYLERAAEKLREQGSCCRHITIFIQTSPFANHPYYSNQACARLVVPTDDTRDLLAMIDPLLTGIWRDGHLYSKAGVMLADFCDRGAVQPDLFAPSADPKREALMKVVDSINHGGRLGKVFFAARGSPDQGWNIKRDRLSPRYTTQIDDLPVVKA
ncbi:TPA: translesion error-prone DNA polymerase V subunit UmuC [Aeromonas veronii]|uniref:translesion error-prone DNA polymerase V subunit UmuC n=1 Tax=Aeromonas TaxID=642 RepID=UPI0022E8DE4B|nr:MULTISPECIES: translesion error-prone DNA polymerase V subunit UmuC [Aeromonas]